MNQRIPALRRARLTQAAAIIFLRLIQATARGDSEQGFGFFFIAPVNEVHFFAGRFQRGFDLRSAGLAEKFVLNIISFYFLGGIAGTAILVIGETVVEVLLGLSNKLAING